MFSSAFASSSACSSSVFSSTAPCLLWSFSSSAFVAPESSTGYSSEFSSELLLLYIFFFLSLAVLLTKGASSSGFSTVCFDSSEPSSLPESYSTGAFFYSPPSVASPSALSSGASSSIRFWFAASRLSYIKSS